MYQELHDRGDKNAQQYNADLHRNSKTLVHEVLTTVNFCSAALPLDHAERHQRG